MKIDDFNILLDTCKKEIPQHTDDSVVIKNSMVRGMPKSVPELSEKVNNKFLNNYLAEIEEAEYSLKDKSINMMINKLKQYQTKLYKNTDILNHDGFFSKIKNYVEMDMKSSVLACGFIMNPSRFAVAGGATLETVASTDGSDGFNGFLVCNILTGTTVNDLYDRIAVDVGDSAGSFHIGAYDDVAGAPTNRLGTAGAFTPDSAYTDRTITEFAIATTTTWLAFNDGASTTASTWKSLSAQTSGNNRYKARAIAALPDPAGASFSNYTKVNRMRISHS